MQYIGNTYICLWPNKLQSPWGSSECEILNKLRLPCGKFDVVDLFLQMMYQFTSLIAESKSIWTKIGFGLLCVHLPKGLYNSTSND